MGLTRVRLGDYIEVSTENNSALEFGCELIRGVTTAGKIVEPKGDTNGVNLKPYKIVKKNAFVYNPSRLDLGSIAFSDEELCLVSHLYIVFTLNDKGPHSIDPEWLYMYFRRPEFCREVTFRNFGSQRPEFNFKKLSDIEIPLPSIDIQRKYAAIYESMLANQRSYERSLNDLSTVCALLLDKCKLASRWEPIGYFLREVDLRNKDGACECAHGVNLAKQFVESKASSSDLKKYKLVEPGQLACNLLHVGRDGAYPIAINDSVEIRAVSPAYAVFEPANSIISHYLLAWFSREEVGRYGWFICDDSIRGSMSVTRFLSQKVPVPDKELIKATAELSIAFRNRLVINERLKAQLKDICPVLIRGSIEEASR